MPLKAKRDPASGIFQCSGSFLGRRVRTSLKTRDPALAEELIAGIEKRISDRVIWNKKPDITFREAATTYLNTGGSPRFLDKIVRHVGSSMLCDDFDLAEVDRIRSKLYPNAAEATLRRQVDTPIRAVLTVAAGEGRAHPPFLNQKRRRQRGANSVDTVRTRWLDLHEWHKLETALFDNVDACAARVAAAADAERLARTDTQRHQARRAGRVAAASLRTANTLGAICGTLIGSGMRPSEAFRLDVTTVYPRTREAYIAASKNGEARLARWPARVDRLIALAPPKEKGPRFLTAAGKGFVVKPNRGGQIQETFNAVRDAAGLGADVMPYTLRHTFATWLYAQTNDLRLLMSLGGWKKPDMAMRYTKVAPADLGERLFADGWDFTGLGDGRQNVRQGR